MAFLTDSNRPQLLWRPPPTACQNASGTASEAPALLMHPWPRPKHRARGGDRVGRVRHDRGAARTARRDLKGLGGHRLQGDAGREQADAHAQAGLQQRPEPTARAEAAVLEGHGGARPVAGGERDLRRPPVLAPHLRDNASGRRCAEGGLRQGSGHDPLWARRGGGGGRPFEPLFRTPRPNAGAAM